jgi:acyl-CoA thioester hydrolase
MERSVAERPAPTTRDDYRVFRQIPTRWMDNDIYGHMNNVVHYSLFDTAVNGWLIDR